ncbi:MAG: peptidoglycan-binding domain-containing protein [Cyanobacteria bacterium P01_A01_bin.114]
MSRADMPLADYPNLKQGAQGSAVEALQRQLNRRFAEFGRANRLVVVTGRFDSTLTQAVKYLQCVAFLSVDGVVGLQTWDFLINGTEMLPVLGMGSCGATVWHLQYMLNQLGIDTPVNGIFEQHLVTQLKRYQAIHHLPDVGVVESATWKVLITERINLPHWHTLPRVA